LLLPDGTTDQAIVVSYRREPAEIVDEWRGRGDLPASLSIVLADGEPRSHPDLPDDVDVTHVSPGDLTGVGVEVTRLLEDAADGDRVVACVDSLSALLQYADLERTFRFLHALVGQFDAADAAVHAHLDPATQDEQSVETLAVLFDAAVEYTDDGWRVRTARY
jgi:hypothetical protein